MATFPVTERTTQVYTTTVKSEQDTPLQLSQLTTLTLTLYDTSTGTIVNGRNAQNVLNANDVTFHATSGLLTWTLQPADLALVTPNMEHELHVALFAWSWGGGTKFGYHEIKFLARDLEKVA